MRLAQNRRFHPLSGALRGQRRLSQIGPIGRAFHPIGRSIQPGRENSFGFFRALIARANLPAAGHGRPRTDGRLADRQGAQMCRTRPGDRTAKGHRPFAYATPNQKGDNLVFARFHIFTGPVPDLDRVYPRDLSLPSDLQWLRDNPEAVSRIRTFRDETRTDKRVLLLTVRVLNPSALDGWTPVCLEGHPAHLASDAARTWTQNPTVRHANDLALHVITADADVDAGHALTVLRLLVLPDLSELSPNWAAMFAPKPAPVRHPDATEDHHG
ncbi:hypothetical protein E7811_15325 [Aliigemmobacter aestuarii]|uniref:Uncharacterized protein n=2 Tax=Aliigemmobacter aestuarii TaxID=1445661 RepID=A0A4S3MKW4_9RHOB|nr:hypothetical protein E7811_15325 [Gemmobacter aestuarii]